MKMTEQLMGVLKLIARTPSDDDDDGWAKCSPQIFRQVIAKTPDELVEKRTDSEKYFVRLTAEAQTILKWI